MILLLLAPNIVINGIESMLDEAKICGKIQRYLDANPKKHIEMTDSGCSMRNRVHDPASCLSW
jgi:hypothetical protein